MIIPLQKLHDFTGNKYVFTRAAMMAVEKIENIRNYPEEDIRWKVIPNILKMVLNGEIKYELVEFVEKTEDTENMGKNENVEISENSESMVKPIEESTEEKAEK